MSSLLDVSSPGKTRARRLGALLGGVLLVMLIGALVLGLILVRHGGGAAHPAAPAAGPLSVYLGAGDGSVSKLDATTGKLRWQVQLGSQVMTPPVIANGSVYVSMINGEGISLYALNASTGKPRWHAATKYMKFFMQVTVMNGLLYALDGDTLDAFDANTGVLRWHTRPIPFGGIAVVPGMVYATGGDGSGASFLYALNASTGLLRWRVAAPSNGSQFFTPLAANGVVYIPAGTINTLESGSLVYAYTAGTGKLLWQSAPLTTMLNGMAPLLAGTTLYLMDNIGHVFAFSASDGKLLWSYEKGAGEASAPLLVADGVVYAAAAGQGVGYDAILALNAVDGSARQTYAPINYYATPFAVKAGILYVGSGAGVISALKIADGSLLWQQQVEASSDQQGKYFLPEVSPSVVP